MTEETREALREGLERLDLSPPALLKLAGELVEAADEIETMEADMAVLHAARLLRALAAHEASTGDAVRAALQAWLAADDAWAAACEGKDTRPIAVEAAKAKERARAALPHEAKGGGNG